MSEHQDITFHRACALMEEALHASTRRDIVAALSAAGDLRGALLHLREAMQANRWKAGARHLRFDRIIKEYDRRTRLDGFHVLHDWDGIADQVNQDIIPVDVLNYLIVQRGTDASNPGVVAMLLDYYFMHLLALFSLRAWDEGDADENIDRLNALLDRLQGPDGSGQQFAANAETLILIATSHFELHERGYDKLLNKVRTLNRRHRTNIALGHAASMGSHLRFGFEATYARDTGAMRDDNVADYPWLCFALSTLMAEYAELQQESAIGERRDAIVAALLNGLSADARAFVREPGARRTAYDAEQASFYELFRRHEPDLLEQFERYRPSPAAYSPLSFFFNFSHNVLKGIVVDALLRAKPWRLTLNDLLAGTPRDESAGESRELLATTLMGYARANPNMIRGRLMPVIVYDPGAGRQAFGVAMRKLKEMGQDQPKNEIRQDYTK